MHKDNKMREVLAHRDRPTEHLCSECGWRGFPKLVKPEELDPQQIYDAHLYARRVGLMPCFIGHQTWFLSKNTPLEAKEMALAHFKNGLPTCPKCPRLTFTFGIKLLSELAFVFTQYFNQYASPEATTQLRNLTGQDTPANALLNSLNATQWSIRDTIKKHIPATLPYDTLSQLFESFCRIATNGTYRDEIIERQNTVIRYMVLKREVAWASATADALHRMEKAFTDHPLRKVIVKEMFNREFGID